MKLVDTANAVPISSLAEILPDTLEGYRLALFAGNELPKSICQVVWSIYESNMKTLQKNSDSGWEPKEKKEELFHPLSRFMILSSDTTSDLESMSPLTARCSIVGFGMFRFDTENNVDEEELEVLYCYELQLTWATRRKGLGRKLVELMEEYGRKYEMKKIMLTCLQANKSALSFYTQLGFSIDEISPSKCLEPEDAEDYDYEIMSKNLSESDAAL